MPISAPPTIPQITDPSTFATRAQAWVVWQANELYPALEDSATILTLSTSSTSTTSNTIGTGSKSFTVETGKGYLAGQSLSIAYTTTPNNRMFAVVTSYDSVTGALVVDVQAIEGSGTFTAWSIALAFNGKVATSQLSFDSGALGNRNKIINGDMKVAQRGTTAISSNIGTYGGCDRWLTSISGFTTVSSSLQPVGDATGFYHEMGPITTTGSGNIEFQQRIEAINCGDLNGKTVTITLNLLQTSGVTISPTINLYKPTALDNHGAQTFIDGTEVSLPNNVRTSYAFTTTLGASDASNGLALRVIMPVGAVSGAFFQIDKVQLEVGSIATPFETRPYGIEFALCQRYFQNLGQGNAAFNRSGYQVSGGSDAVSYYIPPMRTTPTVSGVATFSVENCSAPGIVARNANCIDFTSVITVTGPFQYNQTGGLILLSAEL